jgi:hypothetical protein
MVDATAGVDRLIGRDRGLAALDAFLGVAAVGGATLVLGANRG